MPPKFTCCTDDLHKDGAVPVGTKFSIMPESGATHGIQIYFRHLSNTDGDEAEEANQLHDLELRINHKKKSPRKSGAENSRAESSVADQMSPDDNKYQLYTGPFDWRTGGRHSFRAICVNDFQLISAHTTLTRRFDGQITASYLQVHRL